MSKVSERAKLAGAKAVAVNGHRTWSVITEREQQRRLAKAERILEASGGVFPEPGEVAYCFTEAERSAILTVAYGEGEAFNDDERAAWRSAYRKMTGHELDY